MENSQDGINNFKLQLPILENFSEKEKCYQHPFLSNQI